MVFRNVIKVLDKNIWRSSIFNKVLGCRPAALLNLNFFTCIFQGFESEIQLATFQNNYFQKPLFETCYLQPLLLWYRMHIFLNFAISSPKFRYFAEGALSISIGCFFHRWFKTEFKHEAQTVMGLLERRLTILMKIKHSGIFVRNHFFWKKNYIALQVYYGEFPVQNIKF